MANNQENKRFISSLRKKLLDLSKRNNLINYTFGSSRVRPNLRIVDEVPDLVLQKFQEQKDRLIFFKAIPNPAPLKFSDEEDAVFLKSFRKNKDADRDFQEFKKKNNSRPNKKEMERIENLIKDKTRQELKMHPVNRIVPMDEYVECSKNGINTSFNLTLDNSVDPKHNDKNLQTFMFDKDLEVQLSRIYARAKLSESELGINTLYLCFGFLEWYDSENSKESYISPLLTMPVQLISEMGDSGRFFGLKGLEEEPSTNLSLKEKLKTSFNIDLPDFAQFLDETDESGKIIDAVFPIKKYLDYISSLISSQVDWTVLTQLNLSILSFQKIALYQDLEHYEISDAGELVSSLMSNKSSLDSFSEDYNLEDPEMRKKLPLLVADADSSQVSVIMDASDGQNMIVEGPPGTGKSQTITNMISNLMSQNKKVLFVAEKRTALQVVKNRLNKIGLGNFCLELHSNKIRKSEIIDSIKFSLKERDSIENSEKIFKSIEKRENQIRESINKYLEIISQPIPNHEEILLRDLIGQFLKLKEDNLDILENIDFLIKPADFSKKNQEDLYNLGNNLKKIKTLLSELNLKKISDHPLFRVSKSKDLNLHETIIKGKSIFEDLSKAEDSLNNSKDLKILKNFSIEEISNNLSKFSKLPNLTNIKSEILIKNYQNSKLLESQINQTEKIKNIFEEIKKDFPTYKYKEILNEKIDKDIFKIINDLKKLNHNKNIGELFLLSDLHEKGLNDYSNSEAQLKEILKDLFNYSEDLTTSDLKIILYTFNQIKDLNLNHLSHFSDNLFGDYFPLFFEKVINKKEDFIRLKNELSINFEIAKIPHLSDMEFISDQLNSFGVLDRILPKYFNLKNKIVKTFKNQQKVSFLEIKKISSIFLEFKRVEKDLINLNFIKDTSQDSMSKIDIVNDFLEIYNNINSYLNNKDLSKKIKEKIKSLSISEVNSIKSFIKENFINLTTKFIPYCSEGLISDQVLKINNFIENSNSLKQLIDQNHISYNVSINSLKSIRESAVLIRILEIQLSSFFLDFNINESNILENSLYEAKNILSTIKIIDELKFPNIFKSIILNKEFLETKVPSIKNLAEDVLGVMNSIESKSSNFLGNFDHSFTIGENKDLLKELLDNEKDLPILTMINSEITNMTDDSVNSLNFCTFLLKNEPNKDFLKFAWIYSNIEQVLKKYSQETISGNFLNTIRNEYKKLDTDKLMVNSKIIKESLIKNKIPKSINKSSRVSQKSGIDLINHLISKPLSRVSVRDLVKKSGTELQKLMPCFMMSPLSVAQFLPQDSLFDVLIIDEASQIKLEDILSAIVRSKQIIVVGDNKQLPPSNFFQSEEDYDMDDEEFNYESILDMTEKAFDKKRRLKWHYRSQHEDLIKFSNTYFYDSDLILFPSTRTKNQDVGVIPVKVNGVFKNRKNQEEAHEIVNSAIDFIKNNPELSLAIVAINKEQTTLIEDLFYEKSKGDVIIEQYLQRWEQREEDFIIKNLENIQGDERDAIFISMVYGEDDSGNFYNRFGPINSQKGHRRLNVLFSRAKRLMKVFYSIPEEKIIINADKSSKGVQCLKNFVRFLNTGEIIAKSSATSTPSWEPESSIFEEAVCSELEKNGYVVKKQVGESGYFIDLVVVNDSGEYVLGIECDGATYHSSKFMRDRDKTRQMILERLGWKIHRVWSTDWFANSDFEIKKIIDKVKLGK